jgi:hypothetical protein
VAKAPAEIRSLARAHTELALNTLAGIAKNSTSDPARVAASTALLDRGWGKAEQHTTSETTVRYVARLPDKAPTVIAWQNQHEPKTIQ